MQINPLLQNLVEQTYGSMEGLPPEMVQFLQTVNNLFASVSIESDGGAAATTLTPPTPSDSEAAERHLELIQRYSTALSAVSREQDILDTLTGFLSEHLGFDSVRVYKPNPATGGFNLASQHAQSDTNGSLPSNIVSIRATAESKKSLFSTPNPQVDSNQNLVSELSIPLLAKGKLLAVLNIRAQDQNLFDPQTRLFAEMAAAQTSFALSSASDQENFQLENITRSRIDTGPLINPKMSFEEITSLKHRLYGYDPNLRTAIPIEKPFDVPIERLPNKALQVQGQVIGSFGVQTSEDEPLTSEERALLDSISEEVSQALERAQLFETSQRSAAELAVLNEMGSFFSEALNEETIVDGLYTYTSKLLDVPQFFVAYYNEADDTISFPKVILDDEVVTPSHPAAENFKTRPAGTGLTGHIIKNREPVLIQEDAEEVLSALGLPYQQTGDQTQSWLGVPMTMGDQVLGVISVQSDTTPGLYTRHHLELLSTIASQAAVAINNIRLFEQEQERAEQERLVRTITEKVRRGANMQEILQIAIEELSQLLNAESSTIQLGTPEQLIQQQASEEPRKPAPPAAPQLSSENHDHQTGPIKEEV